MLNLYLNRLIIYSKMVGKENLLKKSKDISKNMSSLEDLIIM